MICDIFFSPGGNRAAGAAVADDPVVAVATKEVVGSDGTPDHVGPGKSFDALPAGDGCEVVREGGAGKDAGRRGRRGGGAVREGNTEFVRRPAFDHHGGIALADQELRLAGAGDPGIDDVVLSIDPGVAAGGVDPFGGIEPGAAAGFDGTEFDDADAVNVTSGGGMQCS